MALPKPQLNGDVLAYDEKQTDGINDLESRIGNGISRPMTVVAVTGEVDLITHGNIIYLQGEYTNTASGQRVCNIPTQYAPKVNFQKLTNLGEIQVNTSGNVTHWGVAGSRGFVLSWSIANK